MKLRLLFKSIVVLLLLMTSKVEAQTLDAYLEGFYASRQRANLEKIYLSLERDIFLEEDQILFHGVTVSSFDHRISDLSIGLHVEILSLEGEVLQSAKFRLENGIAHGLIDFSLAPGNYILMAYSDVMKDLSAAFFKGFTVLDRTGKFPSKNDESIQLEGFPEGGKLIGNKDGFLVIKASDASGRGVYTQGEIFTQNGEKAGYFETNAWGLTKIPFQPKIGESYYLKENQSEGEKFPLPEIQESGTTCKLANIKSAERIVFEIQSNEVAPEDSLTVFIFNFKSPFVLNQYQLSEGSLIVNVPYGVLDKGVHQLQVHDQAGELLVKRLFFIEEEKKAWEMGVDLSESGVEVNFPDDLPTTIAFGVLRFSYAESDDSMYSLEDFLELRSLFLSDMDVLRGYDITDRSELLDQTLITMDRSHLDLPEDKEHSTSSYDVGISYAVQFRNKRKNTPLANQQVEYFSEALPGFVGGGETDEEGILEVQHLNFTDSAVFHFSIPDKKVRGFELELLNQQHGSRKEVLPPWIIFPSTKEEDDLSGLLIQQALVKIPNNTLIDYELEEFTLEVNKKDYDERYRVSRMFGNQGGRKKKVDNTQSLHPHPLKLAESMGVRLVSTPTGGYRTADGLAIYWDGMRLTPATMIDNYSARDVAEVEVFQGGPIMFYSKQSETINQYDPSKLTLKGYQSFPGYAPHRLIGSLVFHPLNKDQDNALSITMDLQSIISVSYEGIDENGEKYHVLKKMK
ncbi:hypothetical protein [Cecembia rubra]|uniref:hypothetical protein n=1 Tax=Cecembia rubra TaxID=1485585 RepID=UPI0027146EBA|nr:hypothetical protein [Cecembia rubra]